MQPSAKSSPIRHPPTWRTVKLRDISLKIGSGATPTGGSASYFPHRTNFALVRSQNVFDRHLDATGLAFISDEQAERLRGVWLQEGDILLNITGDGITFARSCIVPPDILPACVNQHVAIIRVNPELADPGYVLSFLTLPDVKSYIESFNAGGSRRAITKGHIESFQLPLPPLAEQRAIASLLGALDDKIELNRRMNATLEAMAHAIFQAWFVDFDPVRAKAEGRETGLPAEIAALFPDGFVESELRKIPRGWRVGVVSEAFDVTMGQSPPGHTYNESHQGLPFFQGRADFTLRFPTRRVYCTAPTRIAEDGDTLVSVRAPVGDVNIAIERCAIGRGLAAVRSRYGGKALAFYSMRGLRHLFEKFEAGGTVFGAITKTQFANLPYILPDERVIEAFMVDPFVKTLIGSKIKSNLLSCETLCEL